MNEKIESFFTSIVETFPDMVWAKDLEGRFIYSNKANDDFLGVEYRGESIGKKDSYFFEREKSKHPEDANWLTFGDLCLDSDAHVIKEGRAVRSQEYGNLRGKILYLDVNKAPIVDKTGKITGTVGSGRDITKEKLYELALAENETRYRALLEANPDLMFLLSRDGILIDWSGGREKLFAPPEFFLNKHVSEVLPPHVAKVTVENLAKLIETGEMQVYRYILDLNGSMGHFESRIVNCGVDHFLTIIRDITDQVKFEHDLQEAIKKAEASNKAKTVFLQNMSHELRTPLIGILGYSEIMSEMTDDKSTSDMAETINRSGHRLLETLDSLLKIARIESNRQELQFSMIDVDRMIRQSLEILTPMILSNNVKVALDIQPKLSIGQDHNLVNSIVMNLLSNAVKFTKDGDIRVWATKQMVDGTESLVFSVEDTGIGIKDEDRELIFEAFRQGSEGYDRAFEGIGLGLTITKKYIELLDGTIDIDSTIGSGSKFTVTIPESVDPLMGLFHGQFIPSILVIDDDPLMHDLTERIFRGRATIFKAMNVAEACYQFTKNSYSLIIVDINLGSGENGLDILRRIKGNPELAGVTIAAVTAYAMAGDRERLLRTGFDYYLSKPFKKKDLMEILDNSLAK
ncbi:MAG: PAS domain S-box protein [Ignavibacteriales bacterium]|nr:PAS domain S-box protein [Ignavibacteriales bacterium]